MTVKTSCPDWAERMKTGRPLVRDDLMLDHAEADRATRIFDRLCLPDVPGRPPFGEAVGDWYRRGVVRPLFGSINRATGVRRISTILLMVPKKNSKTTNTAGLSITALLMNTRPNALFAQFGATQHIAEQGYDSAIGIIEGDATLKKLLRTRDHLKSIEHRANGSTLDITTFDPSVATGGKYAGAFVDELHVLGRMPKAQKVIGQIKGARTAIHEMFLVYTTTQSEEPPAGIFRMELEYARAVRDGRVEDPSFLPLLYEFPEEVQRDVLKPWLDPTLWASVNPNMGRSISADVLAEMRAKAEVDGEGELRRWATQHLNVEIGVALHSDRWEGADYWESAADPTLTSLDDLISRCEVVTVGIDGGGLDDLLGLCVIGRCRKTRDYLVWARAWAHSKVLERRKEIASRLLDFVRAGEMAIGDDLAAQVQELAEIVARIYLTGLLPAENAIGVDVAAVSDIVDALAAAEVPTDLIVGVPQGWRMAGNIKGAGRRLAAGSLWHAGQALMAWCVSNAKTEPRGNAVLITKQANGTAKIDPLLAFLNAFDLMSRNPDAAKAVEAEVVFL